MAEFPLQNGSSHSLIPETRLLGFKSNTFGFLKLCAAPAKQVTSCPEIGPKKLSVRPSRDHTKLSEALEVSQTEPENPELMQPMPTKMHELGIPCAYICWLLSIISVACAALPRSAPALAPKFSDLSQSRRPESHSATSLLFCCSSTASSSCRRLLTSGKTRSNVTRPYRTSGLLSKAGQCFCGCGALSLCLLTSPLRHVYG